MAEKKVIKKDTALIGYIFGIVSIVLAFFTPVAGLIFGIIGLVQSKKQNDELSKKAKKYNILGIILNIVLAIAAIIASFFLGDITSSLANFPVN